MQLQIKSILHKCAAPGSKIYTEALTIPHIICDIPIVKLHKAYISCDMLVVKLHKAYISSEIPVVKLYKVYF